MGTKLCARAVSKEYTFVKQISLWKIIRFLKMANPQYAEQYKNLETMTQYFSREI